MSKKLSLNNQFQPKISRIERIAQMSYQEKIIEQKKKEIQAKLKAKQKRNAVNTIKALSSTLSKDSKSPPKKTEAKETSDLDLFSNDGSFLDKFKQIKEEKQDSKMKSPKRKENFNEQNSATKKNRRWYEKRCISSSKDRNLKSQIPGSSEKSKNSPVPFENPQMSKSPQAPTSQPTEKNMLPPPEVVFPTAIQQGNASVITASPVLLNVPPPQIVQKQVILPNSRGTPAGTLQPSLMISSQSVRVPTGNIRPVPPPSVPAVSTGHIRPVPPPCVPPVPTRNIRPVPAVSTGNIRPVPPPPIPAANFASIPSLKHVQNVPHSAPIQVWNVPTPTSIQRGIPNPKPLDLFAVPTPNNCQSISNPNFIKNIPPPNKSLPPPNLPPKTNVGVPPPNTISPFNTIKPAALPQNLAAQNLAQNILLPRPQLPRNNQMKNTTTGLPPRSLAQNIFSPPPQLLQNNQMTNTTSGLPPRSLAQNLLIPPPQLLQNNQMKNTTSGLPSKSLAQNTFIPPPQLLQNNQMKNTASSGFPPKSFVQNTFISPPPLLLNNQMRTTTSGLPPPNPQNNFASLPVGVVPSLMTRPFLPPSGPFNVNYMPPMLPQQVPPPSFVNQPSPVPPPSRMLMVNPAQKGREQYGDVNAVFTPGTSDYGGMVSLARRVAKCGSDFEEIVKQRRNQDPTVWYLFHKESAAYQQYQQLVKEFKREIEIKTEESQHHKPGDLYEPEEALMQDHEKDSGVKRKRKSRWGDKVWFIPPPTILNNAVASPRQDVAQNPPAVVTRNNPGLIQDTINTHGSKNLTEKEWKKDEDRYKISLLQKELKKKREFEEIQKAGKNKYDHNSDKAVNGRTWEPKLRDKEVKAMPQEAERELHTPEELNNLTQKKSENKDGRMLDVFKYEEFKINEDNIGFKMLQKLGWSKGQGLGKNGAGIVEPIKQTPLREPNQGLGVVVDEEEDDEFAAYRKRLAYKQRTNPLNNSR